MNDKRSIERSIEKIIQDQLAIFQRNSMRNQKVTISVPQITRDKRLEYPNIELGSLLELLNRILGYEPSVLNTQIIYSEKMATILLTFVYLG